jgi:hypothetical protein
MSTSLANVAFADMAGMSQPAADNSHQPMPSTDMSEHCQDGDTNHMDSYCMDHCAHLLALGLQNLIFATEIPGSVILDLVLVVPTPEPPLLWRPPTLNS